MKGLFIKESTEVIEKAEKSSEVLNLLAKGDGIEIMRQVFRKGETFFVSPGDNPNLMEFFYILEGSAAIQSEGKILNAGCYFYVQTLEDEVFLEAVEETIMLYVSSQPVFNLLSQEISEFKDILKLVEEKDMCTYEHNNRLVDYSVKIGKLINLSEDQLRTLTRAALFHDLGKINVPDEILKKPGKLTAEEFEFIKKHPTDGKNIVNKTYMNQIAEVIEQHHERINGSGYPKSLRGDQISIEAKIISVVDSFDAMTSARPYKLEMPVKTVIDELKTLRDIYYDRTIVDILEQILIEENRI